jgi:hypothetical protein
MSFVSKESFKDTGGATGATGPAGPATGATAGLPGSWTPAGSTPPASLADLQAGVPNAVTASPATAWTTGQYVQTATAGAAGQATWTGSAWVGGMAPFGADEESAEAEWAEEGSEYDSIEE